MIRQLFFFENDLERFAQEYTKFDAVIVTADILAMKLIKILRKYQIQIGKDVSLISFDNIEYSHYMDPGITTMDLKQREKGEQAMKLIIDIVERKKTVNKQTYLSAQLIERKTVK